MDKTNPRQMFKSNCYSKLQTYYQTVEDRLTAVRLQMDREVLEAALATPGLQKVVDKAIRAKLKKLEVH